MALLGLCMKNLLLSVTCIQSNKVKFQSAVRDLKSMQLVYSEFGDPLKVVKCEEITLPALRGDDVLVRMLASPVNPSDINTIQGKYPVKVTFPSVPGNEGVGIVEDVGCKVHDMLPGNKVIITTPGQGTWKSIAIFKRDILMVVPDNLGVAEAATVMVNPCTAYRMLTDFINVKCEGKVVIQNGANSAVGQNVIQLCRAWGIKNINIIRNRPNIAKTKEYLECLGATCILVEEDVKKTTIFKENKIEKPSLALNCVGGKKMSDMLRHVQHSGRVVTYGGMSKQPVTAPTSVFIFKNMTFHGFWLTEWRAKADKCQTEAMVNEIITMMCENKLKAALHKMVKLDNYKEALGGALPTKGFPGHKFLLDFS